MEVETTSCAYSVVAILVIKPDVVLTSIQPHYLNVVDVRWT